MPVNQALAFEIYLRALEFGDGARQDFVRARAAGDAELAAAVQDLLAAADEAEAQGFLDKPLAVSLTEPGANRQDPVQRQIGPYQILSRLGEGGFGTVYLARQTEPVEREVALKLIRRDLCNDQLVARFHAERQTLALLNHPNVAQILDAGTGPEGEPYLVMEYIDGVPITQFCDDNQLGLAARLTLFTQVCDGLQHAHQKSVIHRDIKPANVLISGPPSSPTPKVIDFGIARVLDLKVNEQTLATGTGFLGSPSYMSPEQIERSGLDIDTRSDVYGLGVLLHELLTGVPPFAGDSGSVVTLLNRVLEEEPARPSQVVASNRSDRRATTGIGADSLRGDLDRIILKALSKNRERRYESAAAFAADIQRFLRSEPVLARAPSVPYRAGKFVRRHRVGVAASCIILLSLVAGIVGTGAGFVSARNEAVRARAAEEDARQQSRDAEQTVALLLEFLTSVDPGHSGRELKVVALLEAFQGRLQELDDRPVLKGRLLHTYARTYHALGLFEEAATFAQAAFDTRTGALGPAHGDTLQALVQWARALRENGQYELAESKARQALDEAGAELGADHPVTLAAATVTAETLVNLDRPDEAEALHRDVLSWRQRALGEAHPDTLRSMTSLARALWRQNRMPEAVALNRTVLDQRTLTLGERHPDTLEAINELAVVVAVAGDLVEGESLQRLAYEKRRDVLGPEHPKTLTALANLAWVLREKGQYVESERLTRQAWLIEKRVKGEDHPDTLGTQGNLAGVLRSLDRLDEAEALMRAALDKREMLLGPDHGATLVAINDLAGVLARQGRYDEARAMFEDLLSRRLAVSGREHVATVTTLSNLGWVLIRLRDFDQAVELLSDTSALSETVWGPEHPRTLKIHERLAEALMNNHQLEQSERIYREVLALRHEVLGAENPLTLATMTSVALVLEKQGRINEAQAAYQLALDEQVRVLGVEHAQTLRTKNLLSQISVESDPG